MKHQVLSGDRASALTYSEEGGKQYLSHAIELDPHIKEVQKLRQVNEMATKASNPNGWSHAARIPMPILMDWLAKNRLTYSQWSRNMGGSKDDGTRDFYRRDQGVKSRFMRYFMGREFSQLHHNHVTTKQGSSQISVPRSLATKAIDLTGIAQ